MISPHPPDTYPFDKDPYAVLCIEYAVIAQTLTIASAMLIFRHVSLAMVPTPMHVRVQVLCVMTTSVDVLNA